MENKNSCSIMLIIFAILCLLTSGILNSNKGKTLIKKVPSGGGQIGPIDVKKDKTVYLIKVDQNVPDFQWSSVTCELLDEKKEYLFGFGKEFWRESGYDSEGRWSERVTNYKMKITIPKKGKYYLNFETEKSNSVYSDIIVKISKKTGSALPFFVMGLLSLLIGVIIHSETKNMFENMTDSDY